MNLSTIHLEHALPALADLGVEALVPLLNGQGFTPQIVAGALNGLAAGAEKRSARHLVAIAKATAEELLAWEESPDAKARALKAAALLPISEAGQAVRDFFPSLAPFLPSIPGSSDPGKEEESAGHAAGSSAPAP